MITMIALSARHYERLEEMVVSLFPENKRMKVKEGIISGTRIYYVPWLEFCIYHLVPRIAELHGKYPYTTPEWSKHLVRQRVIDNIPDVNPIDTLYDIWKHPEKYAQSL